MERITATTVPVMGIGNPVVRITGLTVEERAMLMTREPRQDTPAGTTKGWQEVDDVLYLRFTTFTNAGAMSGFTTSVLITNGISAEDIARNPHL